MKTGCRLWLVGRGRKQFSWYARNRCCGAVAYSAGPLLPRALSMCASIDAALIAEVAPVPAVIPVTMQ